MLSAIVFAPLAGALLVGVLGRTPAMARGIALVATLAALICNQATNRRLLDFRKASLKVHPGTRSRLPIRIISLPGFHGRRELVLSNHPITVLGLVSTKGKFRAPDCFVVFVVLPPTVHSKGSV